MNLFPRIPERQQNLLPRYRRRNTEGVSKDLPKIVTAFKHKKVDVWFIFEENGFSVLDNEQFRLLYIPSNVEAKVALSMIDRRAREERPESTPAE
jgi:ligand-binding sensor domain-containing protein